MSDIPQLPWKEHFEMLIPGVIVAAELSIVARRFPIPLIAPFETSAFNLAAFIVSSYALGLLCSLLSRAILDSLSERYLRSWVLEKNSHADRELCYGKWINNTKYKADFNKAAGIKTHEAEECNYHNLEDTRLLRRAKWNANFRYVIALSKSSPEVSRRRALGRVIRNLLFPILIAWWLFPGDFVWIQSAATALGFTLVLALYSYSELQTFSEGHDIWMAEEWT